MKISELGEFKLIERFARSFTSEVPAGVVGIGDDCAVLPGRDGHSLLVTSDMLVEDVHFLRKFISPADLGYKALAVNLSDIAAMAGEPKYAVLSMALPVDTTIDWIDEFFAAFAKLAKEEGVLLVGGDTTRSAGALAVNVTLLGEANKERLKFRSSAREKDIVCVSGNLGDSGAGLRALLENLERSDEAEFLIEQHHRPKIFVREGQWLGAQSEVHAMMDVSDGIDSDLRRIMERSHCGVCIELEKIPLSEPLQVLAARKSWNAWEIAASAGEDYCLLASVAADAFARIRAEYRRVFRSDLYPIGEITKEIGHLEYKLAGVSHKLAASGFEHFAAKLKSKE